MLRQGETVYLRIVDYKSGTHQFSLDEVRSGMDIQLVLYLFAVLSADPTFNPLPAGAQYLYAANDKGTLAVKRSGFLLDDPTVTEAADKTPDGRYTKKLLHQSAQEIAELTADMQQAVLSAAQRILSGEACKTPSEEACMFCPVRAHCDKAYQK